jgi:hypothetical protein
MVRMVGGGGKKLRARTADVTQALCDAMGLSNDGAE